MFFQLLMEMGSCLQMVHIQHHMFSGSDLFYPSCISMKSIKMPLNKSLNNNHVIEYNYIITIIDLYPNAIKTSSTITDLFWNNT